MAGRNATYEEAYELLREGRYYDAHEAFEGLWRRAAGGDRDVYQSFALLAAALFHRDRGNETGAHKCYEKASGHVAAVASEDQAAALRRVLAAVEAVIDKDWEHPDLDPPPGSDRNEPTGEGAR